MWWKKIYAKIMVLDFNFLESYEMFYFKYPKIKHNLEVYCCASFYQTFYDLLNSLFSDWVFQFFSFVNVTSYLLKVREELNIF